MKRKGEALMKRVSAVWMAAARTVVWKLLLILLLMATVEVGLFRRALQAGAPEYRGGFAYFIEEGHLWPPFGFGLAFLCVALCLQGCQFSGKPVYTLQRLPLSEETVTLLWAVVHVGCLVILWAWQLVVVWGLWLLYNRFGPSSGQTLELFVNAYESPTLHGLLPLGDASRHVRNIFWVLGLGFQTAAFGYFQRRGRVRVEGIVLLAVGTSFFRTGVAAGDTDVALSLLSLCMAAVTGCRVWRETHEAA